MRRVLSIAAIVGVLTLTAVAQTNLLLNPSFELPHEPDPGNSQIWVGDYYTYSFPNAQGARVHIASTTPGHIDGDYGWEISNGDTSTITTETYQTVGISSGATATFTGWVHTGPGDGGVNVVNEVTINLRDGDVTGTILQTITVDENDLVDPPDPTTGPWVQVTLAGAPTSGAVTLEFTAAVKGAPGIPAAVHLDAFELVSTVACGTPHATTGIAPASGYQNADTSGVIISGSDLNLVSAVKLINAQNSEVLGASITDNSDPTQLVVTLSTLGATPGLYNVVTEQADCLAQVLVDGFVVIDANLLLNASFEIGNNLGNAQLWFGNYATYDGSAVHNPNPIVIDGQRGFILAPGVPDGLVNYTTWQTVPVSSGSTLSLSGWAVVGPGANATNEIIVNAYDGDRDTGTLIATDTVDKTDPPVWNQISFAGLAPTSGQLTVEFLVNCETPCYEPLHDCAAAARLDDFRLLSDVLCTAPHTLSSVNPAVGVHNADTTGVLVGGTGLDQITAIKLVQVDLTDSGDEPETVLEGAITNTTPTELTVTFPTNGAPVGLYNVVTEQTDCITQVLVDGFEIECANPSVFTAVVPGSLSIPQTRVVLEIQGENLDVLTSVSLTQPGSGTVLPGTIQDQSNPSSISVQFNFTDQPIGFYNIVGERDDLCFDPEEVIGIFRLTPEGDNVLLNGGFEDGVHDPWTQNCSIIGSGWFFGAGPYTGDYALGAASNWGITDCATEQSVGLPGGPGQYDGVVLSFWTWMFDNAAYASEAKGEVLADDIPVAEVLIKTSDPGFQQQTYTNVQLQVPSFSALTDIKVRMSLKGEGQGGWGVVAVDDVELQIPVVPCNDPFADADGDGDVDQEDFGIWQICFTGDGAGPLPTIPEYCVCFDVEGEGGTPDNDLDQSDFTLFQNCASGPGVPADVDCD